MNQNSWDSFLTVEYLLRLSTSTDKVKKEKAVPQYTYGGAGGR
jgi:hypothetical protein